MHFSNPNPLFILHVAKNDVDISHFFYVPANDLNCFKLICQWVVGVWKKSTIGSFIFFFVASVAELLNKMLNKNEYSSYFFVVLTYRSVPEFKFDPNTFGPAGES